MDTANPGIRPMTPEERLRALLPHRLELAAVTRLLPADRLPHMACPSLSWVSTSQSSSLSP